MVSLTLWQRYRRNGIRQTKSTLSSVADVVSDWVFYLNVKENAGLDEKYGFYLFIFACISSGMLLALILSFVISAKAHARNRSKRSPTAIKYAPFGGCLKIMLGLQMLVEDIPQFILGALVRSERGSIDPYLVFTWTTSGFNFLLNLLDMIEIEDSDSMSEEAAVEENEHTIPDGYDYEQGSRNAQLY